MIHHEKEYYSLEKIRCLNKGEIKVLRKELWRLYIKSNFYKDILLRRWFLCEFGLSTGLRVSEISNICIKHIVYDSKRPYVWVENGKGNKSRRVEIDLEFRKTLIFYIENKEKLKEPIELNSPLFYSKRTKGKYSSRGLEYMFKKCIELANVSDIFSIHSLRHTYAISLYKATKFNIRYVQKQLGHSSMRITEIYLQTLMSELQAPLKKLY